MLVTSPTNYTKSYIVWPQGPFIYLWNNLPWVKHEDAPRRECRCREPPSTVSFCISSPSIRFLVSYGSGITLVFLWQPLPELGPYWPLTFTL